MVVESCFDENVTWEEEKNIFYFCQNFDFGSNKTFLIFIPSIKNLRNDLVRHGLL